MTTVNIYLTFKGNCEEAFNYYKKVLGGEFASINRFSEMPPMEGMPAMPNEMKDKIMHVSLPVSKETSLMGSDSSEAFGQATTIGNNFAISINTDSREKADDYFNQLSNGGQVTMPMQETFWGSYWGMCTDKFGIGWQVNMDVQKG